MHQTENGFNCSTKPGQRAGWLEITSSHPSFVTFPARPGNLKQSFFTKSGTEANEAAILLARMSTGNFDVVALRHAYSGGSGLTKAVTEHANYGKGGVIGGGIAHAVNAYCYRCPLAASLPRRRNTPKSFPKL